MTLVTGLVAAVPLASHAQHAPKRLAISNPSEANAVLRPETDQRYFKAFFDELRRLGYVENQNLIVEPFGREQNTSGPETLAAEIVRGKPDLVYAVGPGAAFFKEYTTTIPIVALTGDPIALGMADSLSHPGRNFTGASIDTGPNPWQTDRVIARDQSCFIETRLPPSPHSARWSCWSGDPSQCPTGWLADCCLSIGVRCKGSRLQARHRQTFKPRCQWADGGVKWTPGLGPWIAEVKV
jgi:hypothetical protein